MLILTRKPGDTVTVGRSITLKVIQAGGRQVRIGIEASKEIRIRAERGIGESSELETAKRQVISGGRRLQPMR
jgi:carbon storage regulator CsrA